MTEDRILLRSRSFKCRHNKYIVDEKLNTVECGICGEKLNPMWVLTELCNQESRAFQELHRVKEIAEKTKNKTRCKCEHCGKMTKIHRS